MNQHFLTDIRINRYKGFNDFQVSNLKQINLISGRNNIGKTSFMEACYINISARDVNNFANVLDAIKYRRENLNILVSLTLSKQKHDSLNFISQASGFDVISNINSNQFNVNGDGGKVIYNFMINNQLTMVNINELYLQPVINWSNQYIDNFGFSYAEVINCYSAIQSKNKESYLNELIKKFDDSITSFKVINNIPQCEVSGKWVELTELGDGTRHLISIITAMFASENGYIFIDEIDNGVHYTFLEKLWEHIFLISKELNCQVFATTHSKECINAFNKVNTNDDGVYLEFYRNQKNNKIEVKHRDNEQLSYSLEVNGEFRGE